MVRKSVTLSDDEDKALKALALKMGKKEGELLKEAVGKYIDQAQQEKKLENLMGICGLWKNRKDVPNLKELRKSRDFFAEK